MSGMTTPPATLPAGLARDVQTLTLRLTRQALVAADLGEAMQPVLETLVGYTEAAGSGYFQLREETLAYHARVAAGEMPSGPAMDALLAHGLPGNLPLLEALRETDEVLYFGNTATEPAAAGFGELGVCALLAAPVHGPQGELVGALLAHLFQPHDWTPAERLLVSNVAGMLTLLAARLHAEEREQAAHEGALRALGLSLEARDAETQGHTDRVTRLVLELGAALKLGTLELRNLRWGAYLHDLGKISLPDDILLYDGPLTPEMRRKMEGHVSEGVRLAGQLPFLPQDVLGVIGAHHERWDGGGYPLGLRGEEIPLAARLFAVCDVYDALSHARPYKQAWPQSEVLAYLRAAAGKHFDPAITGAFLELMERKGQESAPAEAGAGRALN